MVDLGVKGISAFLMNKEAGDYIAEYNEGGAHYSYVVVAAVVVVVLLLSLSSGVRLAMVNVLFSSSFLSSSLSSHCVLYHQSPTYIFYILYLLYLLPFSILIPLFPDISYCRHSRHILGLPRLPFPSTFWASALIANLSSPILSTCPVHFTLILTSVLHFLA